MHDTKHGMAKFLALTATGLVLVGLLACGALGMSAMAFQAGQAQGYATGVVQAGGEGVAPMPYGYHGPMGAMPFMPLLCCGGFVLLLAVPLLLLPFKVVAFAGRPSRRWRRHCGPGAPWPDEVSEEAREHVKQHFKHGHSCPPGPWMFRHGPWGRRRRSWWTDEEMPEEVKQWFHQRFERWAEDHPPQSEAPADEPVEEPADESVAEDAE